MAMHRSVLKRTIIFFIITTFITVNISQSQELKQQWSDTRNTTATIKNLINDNFLPENAPKVETTTSSDPNASTTEAPYKITRSEFNRIVMRNLRGLIRLYNIELKDALQQSDKNQVQFKKNASAEVSKFL